MNAKQELLSLLEKTAPIKCAQIKYYPLNDAYRLNDDLPSFYNLKVNHTEKELNKFLDSLDFNYDSGYGWQQLFGTIWFTDGSWAERGEYDGSEWWEHRSLPDIPQNLR